MKKLYFPIFLFLLSAIAGNAQMTGISAEVYAVHNGMVGDYDLSGYTTYRIYADFTNANDRLVAVYGVLMDDENADNEDINITSSGSCFEHQLGGPLSTDHSCALYASDPALEFDSYLTIKMTSSCDEGFLSYVTTNPINAPQELCGLWIDDGTWFTLPTSTNGVAGNSLKILIAQVTTNGALDFNACFQTFVNGDSEQDNYECLSLQGILGGCTDPESPLYDPNATVSDGSCGSAGCTDPAAVNYNPNATEDDGSCSYDGCTDPEAFNYEPNAINDDGSCLYPGCLNADACNYDPDANMSAECVWPGCDDPEAANYDPNAECFDADYCVFEPENANADFSVELANVLDGMIGTTEFDHHYVYHIYANVDPGDVVSAIFSVMNSQGDFYEYDLRILAPAGCYNNEFGSIVAEDINCALFAVYPELEYDSFFTIGKLSSCDPGDLQFASINPMTSDIPNDFCGLVIDDGAAFSLMGSENAIAGADGKVLVAQITTQGPVTLQGCVQVFEEGDTNNEVFMCGTVTALAGCTDLNAPNYNSNATIDDGSCQEPVIAGCTDEEACNYMPEANSDDDSCTYPGCMEITACNYDANAGCEDNDSCVFLELHSIEGSDEVVEQTLESYGYEEDPDANYTWTIDGGSIDSGQGTANVTVQWGAQGTGSITVVEVSGTGCMGEAVEMTVTINEAVNVEENGASSLLLYPNPAHETLFVDVPEAFIGSTFVISDLSGRVIQGERVFSNTRTELAVSDLATGIYFLVATREGQRSTLRFTVQR